MTSKTFRHVMVTTVTSDESSPSSGENEMLIVYTIPKKYTFLT